MDLKLRGKRVLVTGSTVGIGFAIAQGLARERAEVIVNGRTEQKVAEAVQRISSEVGSPASGIAADLSSAEGVACRSGWARRYSREQCGHLLAGSLPRDKRPGLVSHLRSQRNERRAALARGSAINA